MRRLLLGAAASALALTSSLPATAGEEPVLRWIAYVRGNPDRGEGALVAVRSDGSGERTLIEKEVVGADLGGPPHAYAILGDPDDPSASRLKRVPVRGDPQELHAGPDGALLLGVAASARDDVAIQRFGEIQLDVPEHLEGALEELARFDGGVLAPPSRPPGTTDTVATGDRREYDLLFTNDPQGRQAHVDQVNVFIRGAGRRLTPPPDAFQVQVRGVTGSFACGAAACFLDWEEDGIAYSAGEFGSQEEAVGFAESLQPMEDLVSVVWRSPQGLHAPQLVVLRTGSELELESVTDFCECSFTPVDWNPAGTRLLVITEVEGFTTLHEYGAGGEPRLIREGTERRILDASYGPDGILVLEAEGSRARGDVRTLEGEVLVEGGRWFDVEGTTLAYVAADRSVVVRDLETGREDVVGEQAFSVSVSPDVLEAEEADPPFFPPLVGEGFPWLLAAAIAAAVLALVAGTALVVRSRRR